MQSLVLSNLGQCLHGHVRRFARAAQKAKDVDENGAAIVENAVQMQPARNMQARGAFGILGVELEGVQQLGLHGLEFGLKGLAQKGRLEGGGDGCQLLPHG